MPRIEQSGGFVGDQAEKRSNQIKKEQSVHSALSQQYTNVSLTLFNHQTDRIPHLQKGSSRCQRFR